MIIIPRGGAEIDPSGVVTGRDQAAVERTATLTTVAHLPRRCNGSQRPWEGG
jgi:hypothetical protein